MGSLECSICQKKISSHSNLTKHLQKVHGCKNVLHTYDHKVWNNKCLEINCNKSFAQNEILIKHLKDFHDIDIEREILEFSNMVEFFFWKLSIEEENKCHYKLKASKGSVSYLECHRSGKIKGGARFAQKLPKKQGSCKLDRACTSTMKVTVTEKVCVKWIKTHYGHAQDLRHLRISKVDRALITSQLTLGLSPSRILDLFEKQENEDLPHPKLITRKDIINIKRSLNFSISDSSTSNKQRLMNLKGIQNQIGKEASSEISDAFDEDDNADSNLIEALHHDESIDGKYINEKNICNSNTNDTISNVGNTTVIDLYRDYKEASQTDFQFEADKKRVDSSHLKIQVPKAFSKLLSQDLDTLNSDIEVQVHSPLAAINNLLSSKNSNVIDVFVEPEKKQIRSEIPPREILRRLKNLNTYKYINSNIVKRNLVSVSDTLMKIKMYK